MTGSVGVARIVRTWAGVLAGVPAGAALLPSWDPVGDDGPTFRLEIGD